MTQSQQSHEQSHHDPGHHQDPTFYRSPREAAAAPPEKLAYVAAYSHPADGHAGSPDGIAVVDTDPASPGYARVAGFSELPHTGDELHHFGWNACSSALSPTGSHTHGDRRYLVVPGIRSSRISILDTRPDPRQPRVVKVIGPEELARGAGYSRPHTVHCGPGHLYVSCLGGAEGDGGPGGIALLDHATFEVAGAFEKDRGDQYLAYDAWWHLNHNVIITSEWGTPAMIEGGVVPDLLLGNKYGHRLHFWDWAAGRHAQTVDLGEQYQMTLEVRPAHDPARTYGFVGVVVSTEDLSASVWLWHSDGGKWAVTKVITIGAEPAPADLLPPLLRGFGAVPPLVTDIALSVDDQSLYVSCWGTGELKRYDVSDPFHPRETGSVRIGGIAGRAAHPARPGQPLAGGPQMVEVSRDGKRVYFTNSLYASWDTQFYPDGTGAWFAKADAGDGGGITLDDKFFLEGDAFRGRRVHQVRLEGGDASSDSYCYSS